MRKKLFFLSLVLTLLLVPAGVALARVDLDTDTVVVPAVVCPYAEIRGLQDPSPYPFHNPLGLTYIGYEGETHWWGTYFNVVSNTYIGMQMDQVDFTHKRKGDTFYTSGSVFNTSGYGGFPGMWTGVMTDSNRRQAAVNYIQGQSSKWYLLSVMGQLGDVHEQAAGEYEAQFTVTVFAP